MSASDSHRAEVEQQIMDILHKTYKHAETTYLLETVGTEAIMALLDSERERWIGEVRSKLPAQTNIQPEDFKKQDLYMVARVSEELGKNKALDAVSRVLDELA